MSGSIPLSFAGFADAFWLRIHDKIPTVVVLVRVLDTLKHGALAIKVERDGLVPKMRGDERAADRLVQENLVEQSAVEGVDTLGGGGLVRD